MCHIKERTDISNTETTSFPTTCSKELTLHTSKTQTKLPNTNKYFIVYGDAIAPIKSPIPPHKMALCPRRESLVGLGSESNVLSRRNQSRGCPKNFTTPRHSGDAFLVGPFSLGPDLDSVPI